MKHFSNSAVRQSLTDSERRVAQLMADEGLSDREIAARLGFSEQTVKNYLSRAIKSLGVKNRIELAVLWNTEIFQLGLQP